MIVIMQNALLSALEGAKASYPNEFLGFFRGERKKSEILLTDLIIPPTMYRNRVSVGYNDWLIPSLSGIEGTFHSHPHPPAMPTRTDLRMFAKNGAANLIACPPYDISSVRAFDNNGKEVGFTVMPA